MALVLWNTQETVGCVRRNCLWETREEMARRNPFSMRWRLSNNRHHIPPDPASCQHPDRKSHCYHFIQRLRLRGEVSPEATQLVSKWGPGMCDFKGALFHGGPLSHCAHEEEVVRHMPGAWAIWPCNWRACFLASHCQQALLGPFCVAGDYEEMDRDFWSFLCQLETHLFSVQCVVYIPTEMNWYVPKKECSLLLIQFKHE